MTRRTNRLRICLIQDSAAFGPVVDVVNLGGWGDAAGSLAGLAQSAVALEHPFAQLLPSPSETSLRGVATLGVCPPALLAWLLAQHRDPGLQCRQAAHVIHRNA